MEKDLINAISQKSLLEFSYKGEFRLVEPYLLGFNQTETLTLSAWQLDGRSGIGWRAYHVHKMSNLIILADKFKGIRDSYNPNDSTMVQIICAVS